MWKILAVLLILVLVYFLFFQKKKEIEEETTAKEDGEMMLAAEAGAGAGAGAEEIQPEPYVPKPNEDNFYKQAAEDNTISAPPAIPPLSIADVLPEPSTPPAPPTAIDKGMFELVVRGDTGAERLTIVIDGMKYPEQGAYEITKDVSRIQIETPRRVDLANVVIKDVSPFLDENGKDTNIRVAAIYTNGVKKNMRNHLFQAGRDPNYISNGLLFWGGEYGFHNTEKDNLDPSAQSNSTLPTPKGTFEMVVKGDVGNEQFRVIIDGLTYPAGPAGTLNEDGTFATDYYTAPAEGAKISIETPRSVDLLNTSIKFLNDGIDTETNKDKNIRVQSITINGDSQDMRPRLFRTGLDDSRLANLRNGGLFWGGDYTFV